MHHRAVKVSNSSADIPNNTSNRAEQMAGKMEDKETDENKPASHKLAERMQITNGP